MRDFAVEQSEFPETSMADGSGKCHLYKTSGAEVGILCLNATEFDAVDNSADWYKLTSNGDEAIEELLGTKSRAKFGTGNLTLGIGTRILVTKEKFASLEADIWSTNEDLDSGKELDIEVRICSEVEQVSRDGSLSLKSAETEATATTAAAARGRWMIPDKEPILKTQKTKYHTNMNQPSNKH